MNAPTLYGITAELNAILTQLEELGGEITPELEQALAINEGNFASKSEDYGHAILNLKGMAAAAKAETPTMRLSLRHSTATEVDDLDAVPAEYKTTKVEVVADKTAIKKSIQSGEAVPGAHLVENVSLQIK